jgi:hypothetical protein
MSRAIPLRNLARLGEIEFAAENERDADTSLRRDGRCTWRPRPERWRQLLTSDAFSLELALDCYGTKEGHRRFIPSEGAMGTTARAAILGSVIRDRFRRTRPEDDALNASAVQLWRTAPHLSELFGRQFKRISDLRVPRSSSCFPNVLPDDLGTVDGSRSPDSSISKLLRVGHNAALAAGQKPTQERCIQYGLFEAAKVRPIPESELTKTRVRRLLRFSLFDLGHATDAVDRETRRRVRRRFIGAMQKHGNVSGDAFEQWLTSDFDNIIHQLSKKQKPDGAINRRTVRQALVEESFDAYFEVAKCMDVGMKTFAAALQPPLNPSERRNFAILYYGQPWLGGLTLLMLQAHFGFLRATVLNVLENPNSVEARGVLIRMLLFYGQMAKNRRQADREAKESRFARNSAGRRVKQLGTHVERAGSRQPRSASAADVVNQFLETRVASCRCGVEARWTLTGVSPLQAVHRVTLKCDQCKKEVVIDVTKADAARLRRQFDA